jgi:non-ribosomal peptide synthetase component F
MTLLAAWKTLLYRYSGQTDISVGSPLANRRSEAVEGLIGYFVNMAVMRTDLSGEPTFQELLRRVTETTLGAYDNQDLPFEQVVEAAQANRSLGQVALTQVTFTLQNAPGEAPRLPGLKLFPEETGDGTWEYDLSLVMAGDESILAGELIYSTDIFNPPTILQMVKSFRSILEAIVADPGQLIDDIPLISETELEQIEQWSAALTA